MIYLIHDRRIAMKLNNITVGNFKNIAETTINVDGITAIVATNNYGKSNVLEAINFGFEFISASPKQRRNMMSWKQGIPLSNSLAGKDFVFGIEFESDSDIEEYRFVKYSFSFSWINDQKTGLKITDESLECRPDTSVRYTSYIKRKENLFRPSKKQTNWRKILFGDDVLSLDVIPLLEDIEITSVVKAVKNLEYKRCDKLDLKSSFRPRPIEFAFSDTSSAIFDEMDIPKTLAVMKEQMPDKYRLFEDIIFDLYPDFEAMTTNSVDINQLHSSVIKINGGTNSDEEDIPFRIKDEVYQLMIKSKNLNQPISIERMSTGTQRVFWLVANAIITGMSQTILMGVDEVETSIHPKLMKSLMEAINDCLEKGSLILTSHSPYLIQYLKPESIYIGVPTDDGTALFKSIKKPKLKDIRNASKKLGMSYGEYIFSLLSGGEDDAKILRSFLED